MSLHNQGPFPYEVFRQDPDWNRPSHRCPGCGVNVVPDSRGEEALCGPCDVDFELKEQEKRDV